MADSANEVRLRSYQIVVTGGDSAHIFTADSIAGLAAVVCEVAGLDRFIFRVKSYQDSSFHMEQGQGVLDTVTGEVRGGYTYRLNGQRYNSEMKWTRIP